MSIYINTYTYKRFYLCTNYSGILSSAMRFQLAQPRGSPFSAQFHFNKMEASIRKATLWILRIQTLESFVEKESSCPSCWLNCYDYCNHNHSHIHICTGWSGSFRQWSSYLFKPGHGRSVLWHNGRDTNHQVHGRRCRCWHRCIGSAQLVYRLLVSCSPRGLRLWQCE